MCTVNELVAKKNPQLVSVYKEVMLYRFSKEKKKHETVERMLFVPIRIQLAIINLILAVGGTYFMQSFFGRHVNPALIYGGLLLFALFIVSEARSLIRSWGRLQEAMPYLLIDELIARKIIVLVPKKAGSSNAAVKAAK